MTAEDRMAWAWRKILYALVIAVVLVVALAVKAFAQEHHHPPEHSDLHHKFYKTWKMPDNRAISCCHDEDCAPAQSRLVNGSWQARNSDDEPWIDVPAHKVETERDSPDGQSHLCKLKHVYGTYVYCFLPAAGG